MHSINTMNLNSQIVNNIKQEVVDKEQELQLQLQSPSDVQESSCKLSSEEAGGYVVPFELALDEIVRVVDDNIVIIKQEQSKGEPVEDQPEYIQNSDIWRQHTVNTDQRYTCLICHKTYDSKNQLYRHIIRSHSAIRYKCDICHMQYRHNQDLTIHRRTHTGEKPYGCDICYKWFKQPSHLIVHMRTHTGEKPYVCDICHNRFNDKSNLRQHKRTHTGEKPYECNICYKRFSERRNLNRHKRRAHLLLAI